MRIEVNKIGKIENNDVLSYSLINPNGIEVRVLNYGGIITDIITPDRYGNYENIVLKYNSVDSYKKNPSYLGALIGRTAGRIADGEVNINNRKYSLNLNYNPNHGHGGDEGFDKKFHEVSEIVESEKCYIELSRTSVDGEEYYPGNFEYKVRYELNESNELTISYYGISDQDTLVNMTNHSYFNLSGNGKEKILDHKLYINSNNILELNNCHVPTGKLLEVDGSAYDFNSLKEIGRDIDGEHIQLKYGNGYDIPWILSDNNSISLKLVHDNSGRTLEVFTDRKAIVVYTHNYSDNEELQNKVKNKARYGVAIEPQSPPIGVKGCFIGDSILLAKDKYRAKTKYRFLVE